MSDDIIRIDIPKVIKSKAPNAKVPKFLVNYVKRIVHQDEINDFFETHPGLSDFEFLEAVLNYFNVSWSVEGLENLPQDGRKYIFASNHPLGGMDGMVIALILGRHYHGKLRVLINDLLMNLHPLRGIFVPVNKTGAQSKKNVRVVEPRDDLSCRCMFSQAERWCDCRLGMEEKLYQQVSTTSTGHCTFIFCGSEFQVLL